ncbi:MAG: hypothetical protein Q8W51_10550 [Candidatus Palauibacterales bacterium]|nr:hypothetical protein [Candidatus Palauibacterales bacterium]MDP2530166.1 hypothetical protein [Candidatus Palauibacterales bacterium]MDP2582523.1 hypothetical protein [Candidatus Palauibacterales bacterium]
MRVRAALVSSKVKPAVRSIALFAACGLAAGALACNQEPAAPGGLSGGTLRAARSPQPVGSVLVTVYHSNGTEVASNYSVGVIDAASGQVYAGITNVSGQVAFDTLPAPGTYCVDALPVGSSTLTAKGSEVPPPDGSSLGTVSSTDAAVLSGPGGTSVQLDKANFVQYCTQTPPVELKNQHTVDVSLTLSDGTLVSGDILSLSGGGVSASDAFDHGYLGIALTWGDLPEAWKPKGLAPDQNPLILLAANPASPDVSLPVDKQLTDPLVFESDFIPSNGVRLTGTYKGFTLADLQSGVTPGSFSVLTEPLMCNVDKVPESSTDGNDGKVELQPVVKSGFQADADLDRIPGAVAIWWHQTGSGDVTFSLRDRTNGGTLTYQSTLSCDDSGCNESKVTGSLAGTVQADWFAGPDAGRLRVTYVLEGLPSDDVEWSVSTSGDQIPDASKSNQSSAFVAISIPKHGCPGQSNDDRWILGN